MIDFDGILPGTIRSHDEDPWKPEPLPEAPEDRHSIPLCPIGLGRG